MNNEYIPLSVSDLLSDPCLNNSKDWTNVFTECDLLPDPCQNINKDWTSVFTECENLVEEQQKTPKKIIDNLSVNNINFISLKMLCCGCIIDNDININLNNLDYDCVKMINDIKKCVENNKYIFDMAEHNQINIISLLLAKGSCYRARKIGLIAIKNKYLDLRNLITCHLQLCKNKHADELIKCVEYDDIDTLKIIYEERKKNYCYDHSGISLGNCRKAYEISTKQSSQRKIINLLWDIGHIGMDEFKISQLGGNRFCNFCNPRKLKPPNCYSLDNG